MNFESDCAHVELIVIDGSSTLIIKNQMGETLLVQTATPTKATTNVYDKG